MSSGESDLAGIVTLGFELLEFLAEGNELLGEALEFGFHVGADRHGGGGYGHFASGAGAEPVPNHLIHQFAGFAFGDFTLGGEVFDQLGGVGPELVDRLLVALGVLESFDRRGGRAESQPKSLLRQLEDRFGGDVGGIVHGKLRLTSIADDVL